MLALRTMIAAAYASAAASAPVAAISSVMVLINAEGVLPGAHNRSLIDSSSTAGTVSASIDIAQGTFTPFTGVSSPSSRSAYSSATFNGSSFILVPSSSNLAVGTGDFTLETWIRFTSIPTGANIAPICQSDNIGSSTNNKFWLGYTNGVLQLGQHSTSNKITCTWAPTTGIWYHVAVVRDSGSVRMYINGTSQTVTNATQFSGVDFAQNGWSIGGMSTPYYLNGLLSSFRFTKGNVIYSASFTPSTIPLTAVSGTAILAFNNNAIEDRSTNKFTLANTGVTVSTLTPFTPDTGVGSVFFGGANANWLSIADSAGLNMDSSDFTVEAWIWPGPTNTALGFSTIMAKRANMATFGSFLLGYSTPGLLPQVNATTNGSSWGIAVTGTVAMTASAWNHIALTRSGSTWRVFVNGAVSLTATLAGAIPSNNSPMTISAASAAGHFDASGSYPMIGYLSNFRVVKGTAVYTSAFTRPTSPVTAISGTTALLNFGNAGIIDWVGKTDIMTVGSSVTATTAVATDAAVKYGSNSLRITTGNYLSLSHNPGIAFGTGNFTIEAWINISSVAAINTIYSQRSPDTAGKGFEIRVGTNSKVLVFDVGSNLLVGTRDIAPNTWVHIAVCRSGSTCRLFVDGVLDATNASATWNITNTTAALGLGPSGSGYNGYIDDFRIVNTALYTSTFTPPTAAFATS